MDSIAGQRESRAGTRMDEILRKEASSTLDTVCGVFCTGLLCVCIPTASSWLRQERDCRSYVCGRISFDADEARYESGGLSGSEQTNAYVVHV